MFTLSTDKDQWKQFAFSQCKWTLTDQLHLFLELRIDLFLKKEFWSTSVLLVGYPCFWISGDVWLGFKATGDLPTCVFPWLHTMDSADSPKWTSFLTPLTSTTTPYCYHHDHQQQQQQIPSPPPSYHSTNITTTTQQFPPPPRPPNTTKPYQNTYYDTSNNSLLPPPPTATTTSNSNKT